MIKYCDKRVWICLRKKVPDEYVQQIVEMHRNVKTKVETVAGMTGSFDVQVGL